MARLRRFSRGPAPGAPGLSGAATTPTSSLKTADDSSVLVDLVRRVAGIVADLGLTEVELSWGEVRLRVQRAAAPSTPPASSAAGVPAVAMPATSEAAAGTLVTVEAPMVGTFYRASSPTAEPYVREGETVKQGQVLCIVEAMKLMNEIESRFSGRLVKILVENGQPVEYGQALFLIDPHG
jgi:acetyl-CoA carboxylase biotin carboxyl carrier protein